MKVPANARFRRELEVFDLRFTCDDCAMFDPDREACAHEYPTEEHRDATRVVVFCKEFELA